MKQSVQGSLIAYMKILDGLIKDMYSVYCALKFFF